jgi:hypothetical protein
VVDPSKVKEDDTYLTELDESLLIFNTIISLTSNLVPAVKNWDIKENDYVYMAMIETLIIQINKFCEEYQNHFIKILKKNNKGWIIKIHAPLFKCLIESKIRVFRNRHLAHPHRDWNGNFIFLMDTVQNSKLKVDRYDILFLGECVTRLILNTAARLKNEYTVTMGKFVNMTKSRRFDNYLTHGGHLKSWEEVEDKISKVEKECEKVFQSIFPDERTWKRKTQTE